MTIILQGAGIQAVASAPAGPQFSSAEIGAVNASTLVVTFDQDVLAAENDYGLGVTIKVNGVSTSISGGIRQANHAVVYYDIPVLWHGSSDVVTWEYDSATGIIVAESDSTPLGDVAAQSVTNNCEYAALLDLQADMLVLNDGDAIPSLVDQSSQGHNFTMMHPGAVSVIKQTDGDGYPYAQYSDAGLDYFDGGSGDWIDNLNSFTTFSVESSEVGSGIIVATKMNNFYSGAGWAMFFTGVIDFTIQEDGGNNWIRTAESSIHVPHRVMATRELISKSEINIYRNGIKDNKDLSEPPVNNYSSTEHILLGVYAADESTGHNGKQYALLICAPAPSSANRAALETRLGARYGLTVP